MNNGEKNKRPFVGIIISFLVSGIFATLLSLLLAFLISVLVINETLPEGLLEYSSIICVALASFLSGFVSAKLFGRALLTSSLQGIVNTGIMYFTGLIIFVRVIPQSIDAKLVLACIASAVAGGICAAMFSSGRYKIKK